MCNGNCSGGCTVCDTIKLGPFPRGLPGQAATVAVGTTTTGAPGTQAQVIPVGTPNAQILDFVIPAGANGQPGNDGVNAFTVTTAPFVVPPATGDSPVVVTVVNTSWMVDVLSGVVGQTLRVYGAGDYRVAGIIGSTQVILINARDDDPSVLSYQQNAAPGTVIATGARVSPGGIQGQQGIQGLAATLNVGTTTTLSPGSQATVTAAGTPQARIFNFGIPAGLAGTNGHTPVITFSNANPVGGVDGDLHVKQVNGGLIQFWAKISGVWTAGVTVLGNRLVGNGPSDPNTLTLIANDNDTFWQTSSPANLWIYGSGSWTILWTAPTGGGGGVGTFQQVSDASPVLSVGRRTGTNVWMMERSIQYLSLKTNITSLLTTTISTNYEFHELNVQVTSFTLDYTTPTPSTNCRWIIQFTNASTTDQTHIVFAANRWSKSQGVVEPEYLNPGEVATIHCTYFNGHLNITHVEQGVTII